MITTKSVVTLKDPYKAKIHGRMVVYEVLPNQGKKHETWVRCIHEGESYQEESEERDYSGKLLSLTGDNAVTFGIDEVEEVGAMKQISMDGVLSGI